MHEGCPRLDARRLGYGRFAVGDSDGLLAGRYRLVQRLAVGGMSTVWQAWDERLNRPVAVKQLHHQLGMSAEDADLAAQRAMREARITARLHHPNAVEVLDIVDDEGRPALVMQYVPSRSLQVLVREGGPLPADQVARVGTQIAAALAAAHRAGIIHRDVKPGNVLITDDGIAMLTDFGISHARGDMSLTSTGLMTGTPAYLAPEIARGGTSSEASDVYSLGATLYMALEGAPPFGTDQNAIALLHKVASGAVPPPRHVGPLSAVLMRMLSTDPAARPSMVDVANALAATDARPDPYLPPIPLPVSSPPSADLPASIPVAATFSSTAEFAEPRSESLPSLEHAFTTTTRPVGRRATWVPIAAAVAVIAVASMVAGFLLTRSGGTHHNTAGDRPSNLGPATTVTAPGPGGGGSTSTGSSSATAVSNPGPSSSNPTSAPPPVQVLGQPSAAELAHAVVDYYRLVPHDLTTAWQRLTPKYQRVRGLGFANYVTFWNSVERIEVKNAVGDPPHKAIATLIYFMKDNTVKTARVVFWLKSDHGELKINKSEQISAHAGH